MTNQLVTDVPELQALTPLQAAFLNFYTKSFNGSRSMIEAQRSLDRDVSVPDVAKCLASEMLTVPHVMDALRTVLEARSDEVFVDVDYVIKHLKLNVERGLQLVAVRDKQGNETGEFKYSGGTVNGALALLAKATGGFIDRKVVANINIDAAKVIEYGTVSDPKLREPVDVIEGKVRLLNKIGSGPAEDGAEPSKGDEDNG